MNAYLGRYAELYDLFYENKPYEAEAAFVRDGLRRFGVADGARLLDIACGTGRHAMAFERFGYEVTGVDSSDDMLTAARKRAEAHRLRARFAKQDMRALDLSGETFDAVTCLFDAIGHVVEARAVHDVMGAVHRRLRIGGLFVGEFWHASAVLRSHDPVRIRRFKTPTAELIRVSETSLDVARQVADVQFSVYELRVDGTYESIIARQENRFFLVDEMATMLRSCGFEPLEWCAGFTGDPIDEDTWHIVAFARRGE